MKVKASPINTTAGTIFVLKTPENRVLHSAPNKWKTKHGAEKWATENGFNVQHPAKKASAKKPSARSSAAATAKKRPAKPAATKCARKTAPAAHKTIKKK